jgi:peptide/nickel transport system substrate-binding protein
MRKKIQKVVARRFKKPVARIGAAGGTASESIDRLVIKRWSRIFEARRTILMWWLLMFILFFGITSQFNYLKNYNLKLDYVDGGSYSEGVIGRLSNLNPIYASSEADQDLSRLVFASLYNFDSRGVLVPDLAESYKLDDRGVEYTVTLKPNLMWSDGAELNSDDVVFTVQTVQDPASRSPLYQSWRGVSVSAVDARTVKFVLSSPLTTFPQSLNLGLLPKHTLSKYAKAELRAQSFNTSSPVGSGPYRLANVENRTPSDLLNRKITLSANENYHSGKPKISVIYYSVYDSVGTLKADYESNRLDSFTLFDSELLSQVDLEANTNASQNYSPTLTTATYAFLKSSDPLLSDAKVRKALVLSTHTDSWHKIFANTPVKIEGPLLSSHIGFDASLKQVTNDVVGAEQALVEAGWLKPPAGLIRQKDGKELEIALTFPDISLYRRMANAVRESWQDIGFSVKMFPEAPDTILQNVIAPHSYQALIYGINIGPDPDVYAFWHSKEAAIGRFNLSEYKSPKADSSLEAGRTRISPVVRANKYKGLLEAWRDDNPAVGLYQPTIYTRNKTSLNYPEPIRLVSPSDRFNNVNTWQIKQSEVAR